ncbi:MAG TPA: DUF2929 family protein [Pseudogracilibacillus sp.]|nr:DUF2929 family protein [Pseudogracilibacillus sp.]
MRFIVSIIWALLIGAAISYVLASMGNDAFNLTQSLTFSAISFVGILIVDLALSAASMSKE